MNIKLANASIPLLRWTLGLVVVLESIEFILSNSAAHFLVKAGLPSWIQTVLGGSEIFGAVLFLLPFTAKIGSYLLLIIFALAVLLHILHGQFNVGGLAVYAAAVLVCLASAGNTTQEASHERL
jgi:DoxX-like family